MGMIAPAGRCKLCYQPTGSNKARYCAKCRPPSKHGNVKVPDPEGGPLFDSAREAERGAILRLRQKAGQVRNLRRQVSYTLTVNDEKVTTYVADFVYEELIDGAWSDPVVEDVKPKPRKGKKSYRTAYYKLKARLFKACLGFAIREV